jgi:hypothetical protein
MVRHGKPHSLDVLKRKAVARHHCDRCWVIHPIHKEPQDNARNLSRRSNSGSFAMLAAIRRVSSRLSSFAVERRRGRRDEINLAQQFAPVILTNALTLRCGRKETWYNS